MNDLIERMRLLELDHEPDGWPAVQMRDITALLDALEAYRKRRGEPVALMREAALHLSNWLDQDACECEGPGHQCGRTQVERCRDRLFDAAPQPAEPVKVLSDADILDLWTGDTTTHSRPVMGKNKVIAFARALLAREAVLRDREANSRPTEQEPFGYFKAEPFGWTDCSPTDEGAIPLYERPAAPPPAQQERKPLTDEQIMSAIRSPGYDLEDMPDSWAFTLGVRFAERHHGITED